MAGNRRSSWSKHDDRSMRALAARGDLDVLEYYHRFLMTAEHFRTPTALAARLASSRFMMEDVYDIYTAPLCTALTRMTDEEIDLVLATTERVEQEARQ